MNTSNLSWPTLWLITGMALNPASAGQPYTPSSATEIVQSLPRLPWRTAGAADSVEVSPLRAQNDAKRYIALSQRTGDARYLGYALAAITPWLDASEPPLALLHQHALIQQAQHRFDDALVTLSKIVARDPSYAQAWLTRAVILQVQGRPAAAVQSCRRLTHLVSPLVLTTCTAGAARLTARAPRAYRLLQRALDDATERDRSLLPWSLTVLADLAEAADDADAAKEALRQAVQLDPADIRPRLAYADLLLRRGEAQAVLTLVADDTTEPLPLLRRALAAKALALPQTAAYRARLEAYFTASAMRGETLHLREAALADLQLFDRPERALERARRNWEQQREFADTRLILDAAIATGDLPAARPVVRWLEQNGSIDVRLARQARALRRGGGPDAT